MIEHTVGASRARVLLDSIWNGKRILTIEARFPRVVLAELNTHRQLSKNAASSRAIPTDKYIAQLDAPYVPVFTKNKKGMVGTEELPKDLQDRAEEIYRNVMYACIDGVRKLNALVPEGLHKEDVNRLLEPFLFVVDLITATEWDNFFRLRTADDAMRPIRDAARAIKACFESSVPVERDLHAPLIQDDEQDLPRADKMRISAGRCARISYLTHEGKRDRTKDIELGDRIKADRHLSPFEHVAYPEAAPDIPCKNFVGWHQLRADIEAEIYGTP